MFGDVDGLACGDNIKDSGLTWVVRNETPFLLAVKVSFRVYSEKYNKKTLLALLLGSLQAVSWIRSAKASSSPELWFYSVSSGIF